MPRVVLLLVLVALGCTAPVRHGLDESAANEVVAALERSGIGADKTREDGVGGAQTFTIRVTRADTVRALDVLQSVGLPKGKRSGFAEVYAQPSLVPTATEERARYVEALSGEIARTLETIDGVVGARVHLVLAETDPLSVDGKPRVPARAAVLLKARSGPPPVKELDVQRLVGGSVPGLEPAAVAVVLTPASEATGATPGALAALGPLRVSPGTRPLLLTAVAIGLLLLAGLATLLLITARRLAALQERMDRPA